MKSVLVTGASGFVGSHVCAALRRAGCAVHPVGRAGLIESAALAGVVASARRTPGTRTGSEDVGLVHCAGGFRSGDEAWDAIARNVVPLLTVLDTLSAGIDHVVLTSSVSVYGIRSHRADGAPNPDTPYGQGKWLAEEALRLAAACAPAGGTPLRTTVLRLTSVVGAGNTSTNAVSRLAESIDRGTPFRIVEGAAARDYVGASDVGRAVAEVLTAGKEGTFDFGSGTVLDPEGLVDAARGVGFDVEVAGEPADPGPPMLPYQVRDRAEWDAGDLPAPAGIADLIAEEVEWRRAARASGRDTP